MTVYDTNFYDRIRGGCQASAAVVAPTLAAMLLPSPWATAPTVVDVGCGEGWWGQSFADLGCDVTGIDGDYVHPDRRAPGVAFVEADLARFVPANLGDFDLAVCLEVAEHLPPERALSFIASLCDLAPIVAFSAAIPGQGGANHVNERHVDYWADLFAQCGHGWWFDPRMLWWSDDTIEPWYRENLVLFAAQPPAWSSELPAWTFGGSPLALVHPEIWGWYRP